MERIERRALFAEWTRRAIGLRWGAGLAASLVAAGGCGRDRESGSSRLILGAFSVLREAIHDGVLPAFSAEVGRSAARRPIRFEESYNASGAQARAIAAGFDADVALLSMEPDLDVLKKAGLALEDQSIVARSLVVLGVRPGNPRSIRDWSDLARPGVSVVYADPKTSGGARWNINAIYGAALGEGGPDSARERLARVQANVLTMDASGRQSLATFLRGTGDVLVTYENDLRLAQRMIRGGPNVEIVVPPRTLLIENPGALVRQSVDRHGNAALAREFLGFLNGPQGQGILAQYGFRPTDAPPPPGTFSMADLGGWRDLNRTLYAPGGVYDGLFTRGVRR